MATRGQVIHNSVTHERITFLETSHDTQGQRLVFECAVTPGGARLAPHVHADREERFWVLSGTLGVMLDSTKLTLYPGQSIVLPARKKHQWWNAGEFEVHFRVEVTPARNLESVLEATAGLAAAGHLAKNGMPRNPLLLACLARRAACYTPAVPIWLQKPILAMGAGAAFVLGYDTTLHEYAGAASAAPLTRATGHTFA